MVDLAPPVLPAPQSTIKCMQPLQKSHVSLQEVPSLAAAVRKMLLQLGKTLFCNCSAFTSTPEPETVKKQFHPLLYPVAFNANEQEAYENLPSYIPVVLCPVQCPSDVRQMPYLHIAVFLLIFPQKTLHN